MTARGLKRVFALSLAALLAAAPVCVTAGATRALAAEAQGIRVRAGQHEHFVRLVFDWPAPVGHRATVEGRTLRVRFDRPLTPEFVRVLRILRRELSDIRLAPDGQTVVAALKDDFTVRSYEDGNHIVVDLTPAAEAAPPPPRRVSAGAPVPLGLSAATETAALSKPGTPASGLLPIRIRHYRTFGRLVFGWPRKVGFTVDRHGQTVTIRFTEPARIDLEALRKDLPSQISTAVAEPSSHGLQLRLMVAENAQLRYFHHGASVVFDVVARESKHQAEVRNRPPSPPAASRAAAKPAAKVRNRPMPPPLVSVDARRRGEVSEIRFNWRHPVAAAVFRRESRLWVVFDQPARLDLGPLRLVGGSTFAGVTQRQDAKSVQVRLPLGAGFHAAVRRDGNAWIVTLASGRHKFVKPVALDLRKDRTGGAALEIATGPKSRVIAVSDPDIGDTVIAVATATPGLGLHPVRRFPEFVLLHSDQGIAVRRLDDSVRVESRGDRVVVSRPGGLNISPFDDRSLAARVATGDRLMVDLARWRFGPVTDFERIEHELFGATLLPKGRQRNAARLGLARFYVGYGMGAEAIGVIETLLRDDPALIDQPRIRALRGVANYLNHHFAEAAADLEHLSLAGVRELYPWRAAIAAARGDWKSAHELFKGTDSVIAGMPPRFALKFGLLAAEAALSVNDLNTAETRLAALSGLPANGDEVDQETYLRAHLLKKQGKVAQARELWKRIAETGGREGRAKARLADINTQLELKEIKPAQAIAALEKLRFAWRNGVFEFDLLQTLGRLYADVGDLRRSLVTLREAATYFKGIKGAQDLTEVMRRLFRRYYLDGEADRLRPVVALGLFNEFRELTPSGKDGDRMIRKLSERLIAVDLLDQAAELLDHQVRFRLEGREKAEAGTRLAEVLLMDERPADALRALETSKVEDIPDGMAGDRRFMRAEALLKLKQTEKALQVIAADHNDRFDLLRAQIYWQAGKWNKARLVLARLTGGYDPAALTDPEARLLLRRAVALRLAHNRKGIAFLRERFDGGMEKTKLGRAFKAVVGRSTENVNDFEELARQAAELDTFAAFLDALHGKNARKAATGGGAARSS